MQNYNKKGRNSHLYSSFLLNYLVQKQPPSLPHLKSQGEKRETTRTQKWQESWYLGLF